MSTEYVLPWTPPAAQDATALMEVLYTVTCALKTQTLASPYLTSPEHKTLHAKISELVNELHRIQVSPVHPT